MDHIVSASTGACKPEQQPAWQARLDLRYQYIDNTTRLTHSSHYGPLRVQRPFYPEGKEVCHSYILHPPGGLVGGDQLEQSFTLEKEASALLTTPAAGKVYRAGAHQLEQRQTTRVVAAEHACIEWLPQETIVFDGARVALDTTITLSATSTLFGWDIVCLGRPAGNQPFQQGYIKQATRIIRDETLLLMDRSKFTGNDALLKKPWGLQGAPTWGTFYAVIPQNKHRAELIEALRQELESHPVAGQYAVTLVNDVILLRFLGQQAEHCRQLFTLAWHYLRKETNGRESCIPRIWNT
ncbi:MAG: urease accessory protein UreD [Pseudomonadales bacterium]